MMRFGYADPPYLGQGVKHYGDHPEAHIWDSPEGHRNLVARLVDEFPDGWVLCLSSPSLRVILPMCPDDCRVGAWVKPFAVFKPNVNPAYAWEPVVFWGGRRRERNEPTVRDWHSENVTLRKGLVGAKPYSFNRWIIDLMGATPRDDFVDLFPGTGGFGEAWGAFCGTSRYEPGTLFEEADLDD